MAETADFELVQAVRGMDGRISDPSARMTSKMDRSKQRRGLGNPMVKSKEVRTGTLSELHSVQEPPFLSAQSGRNGQTLRSKGLQISTEVCRCSPVATR